MSGVTLSSISQQNQTKDFFGTTSLLVGLGFRLGNAIKLTAGSLTFYKSDTNPLVARRSLAVAPFTGVSIDLDLKPLFNGISGFFTK